MTFWAGVTDNEWYTFPDKHGLDAVNFGPPSSQVAVLRT